MEQQTDDGSVVGATEGLVVGTKLEATDGLTLRVSDGKVVGTKDGATDGFAVGAADASVEGTKDGATAGLTLVGWLLEPTKEQQMGQQMAPRMETQMGP